VIRFPVTNIKGKACATSIWLSEDAAFKNPGEAYGQVVKLGLECFFTPLQPLMERTLMNENFREAVYDHVVARLNTIYTTYNEPPTQLFGPEVF
jgi:hypothetical protein